MVQRAKKTEKGRGRSDFRPGQSRFGPRSIASPDVEQQNQPELCGPLCNLNLMDLPVQAKSEPNHTGLPDQLKAGIESLSGMDMSDVRVHPIAMHVASTAEATGTVVQAAAKKKKKPKPMSLFDFHNITQITQAPQKSSSQIWKGQPQTIKMAPQPAAAVVKQSDSGKANEIIDKIKKWKQSSHGGCDGKGLTHEEIMQIHEWAMGQKTEKGNQKYSVIFGQGSGSFAGGYQMKIIGFNSLTSSAGGETKNATFHITIDGNFEGQFE